MREEQTLPLSFSDEKMAAQPALLTLFLCALWGGVGPTLKLALEGVPPLAIAGWRFLIGLACILLWCRLNRIEWRLPRVYQRPIIGFAALFVLQISLLNLGTQFTSSNHSVVFLNTHPLFVALLAHFLIPNDRLSWRKVGGLMLALAGICVIFLENGPAPGGSALLGDVLVLMSGLLLGVIQIYSKFLVRQVAPVQIVVWEMVYGVPIFFLMSFFWERNVRYDLTPAVVGGVLYQGAIVAAFCFVTWTYLLKRYAASRLSAFQFTTPIFGVILSWLILGETASARFLVGVALVAVGIYLVSTFLANSNRASHRLAPTTEDL